MDYEPRNTVSSEDSVENVLEDSSKQASNENVTQIVTKLFFSFLQAKAVFMLVKKNALFHL